MNCKDDAIDSTKSLYLIVTGMRYFQWQTLILPFQASSTWPMPTSASRARKPTPLPLSEPHRQIIAVMLPHPSTQRPGGAADPGGDRHDARPLRTVLAVMLGPHAHSALRDLGCEF